jgi:plasmid rolling circle replication initiator protein Rep
MLDEAIKLDGVIKLIDNSTVSSERSRQKLVDVKKNGQDRDWAKRKAEAERLAKAYLRLEEDKRSLNVSLCANFIAMDECVDCGRKVLVAAKFCHDPLCPTCIGRRMRVLQAQVFQVFNVMTDKKKFEILMGSEVEYEEYEYILLTLTVRNVFGGQALNKTIKAIHRGFSNMTKLKALQVFKGFIRATEVTRNNDHWNKEWYGSYHPHMHVILAVKKGTYFNSDSYLSLDCWIKIWRDVMGLDYDPSVEVQGIKAKSEGQSYHAAVVEVAKYAVKSTDYLHDDYKVTDTVVSDLLEGLKGIKRIGWGGIFRKIRSKLRHVDVEGDNVDLVGADGNNGGRCAECGGNVVRVMYEWDYKLKDYYAVTNDNEFQINGDYIQKRIE